MKDHEIRELINAVTAAAKEYAGMQQLRSRIAGVLLDPLKSDACAIQRLRQDRDDLLDAMEAIRRLDDSCQVDTEGLLDAVLRIVRQQLKEHGRNP